MKTSVISPTFRARYLSDPADPDAFEGRAVVFDGREDYHARINDPSLDIDEHTLLVIRARAPSATRARPRWSTCSRPTRSSWRASTSCRASGMGASRARRGRRRSSTRRRRRPWAAVWRCCGPATGCASTCASGPRTCSCPTRSWRRAGRRWRRRWPTAGLPYVPASQTPWQEIQRGMVDQLDRGHGAQARRQVPGHRARPGLACRATTTDGSRLAASGSSASGPVPCATGEVAEWLKAAVLKTAGRKPRGFESHPLRHLGPCADRIGPLLGPPFRPPSVGGLHPTLRASIPAPCCGRPASGRQRHRQRRAGLTRRTLDV